MELKSLPLDQASHRPGAPAIALVAMLVFFSWAVPGMAAISVSTLAVGVNGSGDVAVDAQGNVYVGDYGPSLSSSTGSTITRITPTGDISVFATGFNGASGNTFDTAGNLYQSSIRDGAVFRVDPEGNASTYASGITGGPIGNTFDSMGNLYVNSCGGNQIFKVDPNGNVTVFAGSGLLDCPNGLTIDENDNLYAANFNNPNILKIDTSGNVSFLARSPIGTFRPSGGHGHLIYGNGILYVCNNSTNQIMEVTLDGTLTVIAGDGSRGHTDGDPQGASFSAPNGIDLSPDGRFLYINEMEEFATAVFNGNLPLTPARVRVIELFPEPAEESFEINAGLTGAWFDPATSGQGFLFEPIPSNKQFLAAWFTFDETASPAKLGATEHRWFTLLGAYEAGRAELSILLTEGGLFDQPQAISNTTIGSSTLTFSSCTEAQFDFVFDSGPFGSIMLQRVTPDAQCSLLTGAEK